MEKNHSCEGTRSKGVFCRTIVVICPCLPDSTSPELGPERALGTGSSHWLQKCHVTQIWPIRALAFLGHSDWFRDGETIQLEPMRSSENFAGAAGKEMLTET